MSDETGMLPHRLPAIDDEEGQNVPAGLPPVVDAHVHIFPDELLGALRAWFEQHGVVR